MAAPLSDETRVKIRTLRSRGKGMATIAQELGVSLGAVHKTLASSAPSSPPAAVSRERSRPPAGTRERARAAPAARPPARPLALPPAEGRAPSPLGDHGAPSGEEELPAELRALIEAEGGDADLGGLSLQISRCERYLRTLEEAGNFSGVVQVERLIGDLTERRRKLRPPPPPNLEDEQLRRMQARDEVLRKIEELVQAAESGAAGIATAEPTGSA